MMRQRSDNRWSNKCWSRRKVHLFHKVSMLRWSRKPSSHFTDWSGTQLVVALFSAEDELHNICRATDAEEHRSICCSRSCAKSWSKANQTFGRQVFVDPRLESGSDLLTHHCTEPALARHLTCMGKMRRCRPGELCSCERTVGIPPLM